MQKNINPVDKNSPEYLLKQVAGGRYSLLLILIFTVVNLVLLLVDANRYFLFSASVPYYFTAFGMGMDSAFSSGIGTYTITALVISLMILGVYLACWLLSKKHIGWLTAALVLFCVDTAGLLVFSYIFQTTNLLDILLHAWAIYELAYAIRCAGKLKNLAPQPETPAYNAGPEIPQEDIPSKAPLPNWEAALFWGRWGQPAKKVCCKYWSRVWQTTELTVLDKASPMVRQQGGSSGLHASPASFPNASITSSWDTVTPNPFRTKAMMRVSSRKLYRTLGFTEHLDRRL